MRKLGLINVSGSDVSESQIKYGNKMIGENVLETHDLYETTNIIESVSSNVVSMIGVLEHLQKPRQVLTELINNNNVEYLYLSLPLFSLSVLLEIHSPDVFHRQLSGAHTHLYTEKSISYLCNEFGFDIIGEWWFGTDIVDLFRHISISLDNVGCSEKLIKQFSEVFIPLIDSLQLQIDKNHYSSEVHLVIKKKKIK